MPYAACASGCGTTRPDRALKNRLRRRGTTIWSMRRGPSEPSAKKQEVAEPTTSVGMSLTPAADSCSRRRVIITARLRDWLTRTIAMLGLSRHGASQRRRQRMPAASNSGSIAT